MLCQACSLHQNNADRPPVLCVSQASCFIYTVPSPAFLMLHQKAWLRRPGAPVAGSVSDTGSGVDFTSDLGSYSESADASLSSSDFTF